MSRDSHYSASSTKKGPGRKHLAGPGKPFRLRKSVIALPSCPTQDNLTDPGLHLNKWSKLERAVANERRSK